MAQLLFFATSSLQRFRGFLHTGAPYTFNAMGLPRGLEDLSLNYGNDYVAFSITAGGGADGIVQIRDSRAMQVVATPDISALVAPASGNNIEKLQFSPDGSKLIVLNGNFPYFKIFDTSDWSLYSDPATKLEPSGFISINAVQWSHDSRYVAVQWMNGSTPKVAVYDCDTTTPDQVTSITHVGSHFGVGLAWSPDGARLIVGSSGTLHQPSIYETTGWTTVLLPTGYTTSYRINSVAWADNWVVMAGQQAAGGSTRFFYAYNTAGNNDATTWSLTAHTPPADGATFVTLDNASPPHMAYIAQVSSAYTAKYAATPDQSPPAHTTIETFETAFKGPVVMRSYSPSTPLPSLLAAIGTEESSFVQFFNKLGTELTNSLSPAVVDTVFSLDVSQDSTLLAVQRYDDTDNFIDLYELSGQTRLDVLYQDSGWINSIKLSPDGTKLATAPELSPFIVIYDTSTFSAYSNPSPLPTTNYVYPTYFSWSPNSRFLAVCMFLEDEDMNVLRVYDTITTTPTVVAAASKNGMTGANYESGSGAWSPDGTRFVWGGQNPDAEIKVYETTGWTEVALPAVLPPDGHYMVEWSGNFVSFLTRENGQDYSIIYNTGGSMDPSTWTVASYRVPVQTNVFSSLNTTPPVLLVLDAAGSASFGNPGDHPASFVYMVPATGSMQIFGAAIGQSVEAPGDLVEAEIEEALAHSDAFDAEGIKNLVDTIGAADTPAGQAIKNLLDSIALSDAATGRSIYLLIERFGISDALSQQAALVGAVSEAISAVDRLRVILRAVVEEILDLGEAWVGSFPRIAQVIEALMATDGFASRMDARATLALVMTIGESVFHLTMAQVEEMLDGSDELASRMVANLTLIELADVTMLALAGRVALVGVTDTTALADSADPIAHLRAMLAEGLEVEAELVLFGEVYQAWVVNSETLAPSEYENFPFNSMARIGQSYFAASETGLHQLGGDNDDGDPIMARILTGETDFGSPQMKRLDRAYMGYSTRGELVLKVLATVDGQKTEFWYKARPLRTGEVTETRVPIGRGIVSRYWQFEWVNVDGADFELDRLDLQLLNLSRRI